MGREGGSAARPRGFIWPSVIDLAILAGIFAALQLKILLKVPYLSSSQKIKT